MSEFPSDPIQDEKVDRILRRMLDTNEPPTEDELNFLR